MRNLLLIAGLLMAATGSLWCLQGLGLVAWPQESFMINDTHWSWYGGALAATGLAAIVWSRL